MKTGDSFFNLYSHDLARVAVAIPRVRVADPAWNAEQTIALLRDAYAQRALLAVFPELGLSAYSCEDLFHQRALLEAAPENRRGQLFALLSTGLMALQGIGPLVMGALAEVTSPVLAITAAGLATVLIAPALRPRRPKGRCRRG